MTQSSANKTQDQWVKVWGNIPDAPANTWDRYQWFWNPTKPSSMRLSKIGATWLAKKTKFVMHEITLDNQITPRHLILLERILTEPYYIKDLTHLWVHSETDAIMLTLNAGNLGAYLDSLQE